jgi:hypothetical protein
MHSGSTACVGGAAATVQTLAGTAQQQGGQHSAHVDTPWRRGGPAAMVELTSSLYAFGFDLGFLLSFRFPVCS